MKLERMSVVLGRSRLRSKLQDLRQKNKKNSTGEKRYDFAFVISIRMFSDYVCYLGYCVN